MKMGPGNDGPEPPVNILRAIRYGVAAGACRAAAEAGGGDHFEQAAVEQTRLAGTVLHQAAAFSAAQRSSASSLATARSSTRTVTLRPERSRAIVTPEPNRIVLRRDWLIRRSAEKQPQRMRNLGSVMPPIVIKVLRIARARHSTDVTHDE